MTDSTGRRVTANLSLSLDGRYHGPGGPSDFSMFAPYVTSEVARGQLTRIWEGATTVLLGRINAEGFLSYWPTVAEDENADPRDRGYAKWLVDTEVKSGRGEDPGHDGTAVRGARRWRGRRDQTATCDRALGWRRRKPSMDWAG